MSPILKRFAVGLAYDYLCCALDSQNLPHILCSWRDNNHRLHNTTSTTSATTRRRAANHVGTTAFWTTHHRAVADDVSGRFRISEVHLAPSGHRGRGPTGPYVAEADCSPCNWRSAMYLVFCVSSIHVWGFLLFVVCLFSGRVQSPFHAAFSEMESRWADAFPEAPRSPTNLEKLVPRS